MVFLMEKANFFTPMVHTMSDILPKAMLIVRAGSSAHKDGFIKEN